jgi:WD40 repeat protein
LFSIAINASDTDLPDYSRDGASLVLATNDRPQAAAVFFDATTGERQKSISLPSSERSFFITRDQQMFVSYDRSESDAVFGDLVTGQERLRLPGYSGLSTFAISPDGSRLVLAKYQAGGSGPGELTFWSLKSGRRLLALQHPGYIRALTFSPDGNRVLAAVAQPRSSIRPIQIWDATPLPEEP